MHTKADLEKLAQMRIEDSILLLKANRPSSAYYLAGYSVELALKACISKLIQSNVIPDKALIDATYSHKLDNLLSISGLRPQFQQDTKADAEFATNWAIASKWSVESRYDLWDPMSAATLLNAIADPTHGVFQWVKKHW